MDLTTEYPVPVDTTADVPASIHGWTRLWNGAYEIADTILSPDARVTFGGLTVGARADALRGPTEIAALIRDFRSTRPGLVYSEVEVRAGAGFAVVVWNAGSPDLHRGGIDTFSFDGDGRIRSVRSVTGERGWPRASIGA
ncbi:hypothetical protein ACFT5B_09415 [Luteimicrobium sp. NPDC057192]|uniref:hypothetical protein n=1 Tax=Luteimicrobium sp. NPDC057192 TaxID=3346042 RepID=UPI003628EF05